MLIAKSAEKVAARGGCISFIIHMRITTDIRTCVSRPKSPCSVSRCEAAPAGAVTAWTLVASTRRVAYSLSRSVLERFWRKDEVRQSALRRIALMRRSDHQPVAEYVAVLPPDLRNGILDSLTLPERRALEHLLKAREERWRVRGIEDEKIHKAHEAAATQEEVGREAEFNGFVDGLKA